MSAGFAGARLLGNRLESNRHLRKGDLALSPKGERVSSVSTEEDQLPILVVPRSTDVSLRTLGNENFEEEVRGDIWIDGHRPQSVARAFFRVTGASAHESEQLLNAQRGLQGSGNLHFGGTARGDRRSAGIRPRWLVLAAPARSR